MIAQLLFRHPRRFQSGALNRLNWPSWIDTTLLQEALARRFGIASLKKLPCHSDLMSFEYFEFPKTFDGRLEAVALIHKMARRVLLYSELNEQLRQFVFHEAIEFAKLDAKIFERFNKLSNFVA